MPAHRRSRRRRSPPTTSPSESCGTRDEDAYDMSCVYTSSLTPIDFPHEARKGSSTSSSPAPSPSLIAEDGSTSGTSSGSDANNSSNSNKIENSRRNKSVRIAPNAVVLAAGASPPTAAAATCAATEAIALVRVPESDLSFEGDDADEQQLPKMDSHREDRIEAEAPATPTVHVASRERRGRIQYTADTLHDDIQSNMAANATGEDPLITTVSPIIRRRRRIGRPFVASSPMGWNEEYLTSPVSPTKTQQGPTKQDEDTDTSTETDNDEFPVTSSDDDVLIAMPSLGVDASSRETPPSPPQELRRRRRRRGTKVAASPERKTTSNKTAVSQDINTDTNCTTKKKCKETEKEHVMSFSAFRVNYLIVHIAIMLADGLQGTHLYVLYEGYGYSVASLYCLGFLTGAITSPFIGPFVDKIGRKKAAMLYCSLEMFINWLEQFPYFYGLIVSRMIGGITTNLLFSVFESWLVTEHRRRGYAEEKLETILRDSVILSNLAAIASGFLAEFLAVRFGPVGPFEGAVTCTAIALVLVATMWRENYGSDVPGVQSVRGYMSSAFETIVTDTNISRIGLIQGLTEGSLQTFVFLWSPALARFAVNAPSNIIGLDGNGEPAYGLIFGAFMACGVAGGLSEPYVRQVATYLVRDHDRRAGFRRRDTVIIDGEGEVKPAAVEFMATGLYVGCAGLLMVPYVLPAEGKYSFSISLFAFLVYEFMVGLYMPCEGVIRSIYMPTSSVCSVMTMLRVIVNIAVALGVISTNYVPFTTAFAAVSTLMMISAGIQLSMVDNKEWRNFVRLMSRSMSLSSSGAMEKRHFPLDSISASSKDTASIDVTDSSVPDGKPVSRDSSLLSTVAAPS